MIFNSLKKIRDLPRDKMKPTTLIIYGTSDADVPAADAEFASKAIPDSELFLIMGGHVMILADSIDEITAKRVSFLKKYSPE